MPQRTSESLERVVVSERRLHPTWGPKKLRAVLERKHAIELPPAVRTLWEILKRNGLFDKRFAFMSSWHRLPPESISIH